MLLTHAARKRAEISKNRGYNKPESQEARTQRIQNMKDRMPCAACQAVGVTAHGHGHSDESGPQRQRNKQSPAKHTFVVSQQHMEESESDDDVFFVGLTSGNMMDERMVCHFSGAVVLATSSSMREVTKELALADTCCARTVAGLSWVEHHLEQLAERGMPFQMLPDDQPFRFGDGPRVTPLWAAIFPIYVGQTKNAVLVRTSVVAEDVPLLISSRAVKTLGRLVDLDRDLYHFKRLRTTAAWETTATGHIGFHILVGNDMMLAQLVGMDWEAFAADGGEVAFSQRSKDMRVTCIP